MRGVGTLGDESRHGDRKPPYGAGKGSWRWQAHPATPMATARAHPTLFRRPRHYYTRASRLVTFPYWGVALHHLTNRPFVKNLATRNAFVV